MTDIEHVLVQLGISQYRDIFVEQGFDTWETILDITENDFDALGVKLGHRRKLQRKIAESRGLSATQPLVLTESLTKESSVSGGSKDDGTTTTTSTGKRKYRRHPKADDNAPERPASAYVIFSNKVREDLKGQKLSFTELAKIAGENWQRQSASQKEPFEQQASLAKEDYNTKLSEYKLTDQYKVYTEYLIDFKLKQSQRGNGDNANNKRPRVTSHSSFEDSGPGSATGSQTGPELGPETSSVTETSLFTRRDPLTATEQRRTPMPNMPGLSLAEKAGPDQPQFPTGARELHSPVQRDIVNRGLKQERAWEGAQLQLQHSHSPSNESALRRPSLPMIPQPSASPGTSTVPRPFTARRSHEIFNPPPLVTDNTSSGGSTGGQMFYAPSTPLEPAYGPSITLPSLQKLMPFAQPKTNEPRNLPLTRSKYSPFDSPSSSVSLLPSNITPLIEHGGVPRSQNFGYLPSFTAPSSHVVVPRPIRADVSGSNEPLDPVSALLRAGEIVDSSSHGSPGGERAPRPKPHKRPEQR